MAKESDSLHSTDKFENLLETFNILSNKNEVHAMAEGSAQIKNKETISLNRYMFRKKKKLDKSKQLQN